MCLRRSCWHFNIFLIAGAGLVVPGSDRGAGDRDVVIDVMKNLDDKRKQLESGSGVGVK